MKKIIGWSGVALLALLAALGWKHGRASGQTWSLTNGAALSVAGVTHGTDHVSPLAWPWEPWLHRLPLGLAQRLPKSGWMARAPSPTPSLVVWLRTEGDVSGLPQHWTLDDGSNAVARVQYATRLPGPGRSGLLPLHFTAWPRRPETLNLRLWNPGSWSPGFQGGQPDQQLVEFSVKNPQPWRPQPLSAPSPATDADGTERAPRFSQAVQDGDLEFTLTQFQYGLGGRSSQSRPETNGAFALGLLRFAVTNQGTRAAGWFPLTVHAEDGTGNRLRLSLGSTWFNAPHFHPAPWPGEAWRLRVEFSRNTHFTDEELITLPAMPLIERQGPDFLWRTNFNGVALERVGFMDRSAEGIAGHPPPPNEWVLRVDATGLTEGTYVTLHRVIVDDDHDCWREPRGGGLTDHRLSFRFRPGRDAKSVVPVLAVHRSRFVTFVAEPEDVRRNSH